MKNAHPNALIIGILVSASGWGFGYLLNSISVAPVLEYSVSRERAQDRGVIEVTIENLSRVELIKKLKLGIGSRGQNPISFSEPELKAMPPAAEGPGSKAEAVSGGIEIHFTISQIHPRQRFSMRAEYRGGDEPELRLLGASRSVYMYEKGLVTWFARNLLPVVGWVTFVTMILLIALLASGWVSGRIAKGRL